MVCAYSVCSNVFLSYSLQSIMHCLQAKTVLTYFIRCICAFVYVIDIKNLLKRLLSVVESLEDADSRKTIKNLRDSIYMSKQQNTTQVTRTSILSQSMCDDVDLHDNHNRRHNDNHKSTITTTTTTNKMYYRCYCQRRIHSVSSSKSTLK